MRPSPWPREHAGLLFRDATEADLPALQSFRNDPQVTRFLVEKEESEEQLRERWLSIPASETDYSCVADVDGRAVAMGFLEVLDGPGQPGVPEGSLGLIGYIVDPSYAGRGVGTATAQVLLRAAVMDLGLRRVMAGAYADNPASVRILEKAGMRRERYSVQAVWHDELGWADDVTYALLADEWRAAHPGEGAA